MAPQSIMRGFERVGGLMVPVLWLRIWDCAARTSSGAWIEGGVGREEILLMKERRREWISASFVDVGVLAPLERECSFASVPLLDTC